MGWMITISREHPRIGVVCNEEPPLASVALCFTSGHSAEHEPLSGSEVAQHPQVSIRPRSNRDTETDTCTYIQLAVRRWATYTRRASSNPAPPLSPLITCCVLPRAPASLQPPETLSCF